jgi:hypothetical protein
MPDIIQEAWTSVSECTLLAESATDATARQFFLSLANSWKKVAQNYEVLARNDQYLIELKKSRAAEAPAHHASDQRNGHNPARLKMTIRSTVVSYLWRRA